jgi:hypothetical protein
VGNAHAAIGGGESVIAMSGADCDVLIVGLGPVGDCLAALARLQGLSVIAVERTSEFYPLPRAAVFDHEIMRIFQTLGAATEIALLCRIPDRYEFVTASNEVLLDFPVRASTVSGWAETYALHQPAVERVLRERLRELNVDVRLQTTFLGLRQDADGVTVLVEDAVGRASLRARYVVGCDGAWSPVREAMGAHMFDYQFDEPWLVLDTIVEDPQDLPIVCRQICDPQRPVTYMAMSGMLDSYQIEREPHVRAIIETAIAMGRVVCMLDPKAAATRDAELLGLRSRGIQAVAAQYPDLRGGMLMATAAAGSLFPQPMVGRHRLDDVLGPGAALVGRNLPKVTDATLRVCDLNDAQMKPFAASVEAWLQTVGASAALIRPDRHVFGTGTANDLLSGWLERRRIHEAA